MFKSLIRKFSLVALLLLCAAPAYAQWHIVPEPQQLKAGQGAFTLDDSVRIVAPADARAQWMADFLRTRIREQTGIRLDVAKAASRRAITLRIDASIKGDEAYRLDVTPDGVSIRAAGNRGLFWGVQTLRQLLPLKRTDPPTLAAVHITDAPHYPWRGFMLDVARHFYPVDFIKQQIDLASYYKLDVFHWHLTDDQGWRIQIKRYPKLTETGAWRTEADGRRHGGFYTQDQIRDVVEYARRRNIRVVPEIEMPGHASAAIAAYPELSCSGKKIQVQTGWGVFNHAACVGKESSFRFLENVLDEVMALFPSPYLHIGGDEVPEDAWDACDNCDHLPGAEGLQGERALHAYFVERIRKYLAGKNKTMVGWDEILEGHLKPDALVEVWRGEGEAAKALANGNSIILAGPFYLDAHPADRSLQDLYRHNPFHKATYTDHPQKVLGGEAPLWSEYVTPRNGAAMFYPRLLAVTEHFWNPSADDWKDFSRRVTAQKAWLASRDVAYGADAVNLVDYRMSYHPGYHRWRIRAARGFDDMRLHYTTDGSEPTAASPSFRNVLDLYQPATVTVAPFRGKVPYKQSETFRMVPNLALDKPVTFATPPPAPYNGDLTDGIMGRGYDDGAWAGWQKADMDAVVDLGKPTAVHAIHVGFLKNVAVWILLPKRVTLQVSEDGTTWTSVKQARFPDAVDGKRLSSGSVDYAAKKPVMARYVRVQAIGYQHRVKHMQPYIFTDEIVVQ